MLRDIALGLGRSIPSVWEQYCKMSTISSGKSRGIKRCHLRLGGVRCHHTSDDKRIQFYYLPLEGCNSKVLRCMGYSLKEANQMLTRGLKRLSCCSCHQHGRPTLFSLPGSRVCCHISGPRSRRRVVFPPINVSVNAVPNGTTDPPSSSNSSFAAISVVDSSSAAISVADSSSAAISVADSSSVAIIDTSPDVINQPSYEELVALVKSQSTEITGLKNELKRKDTILMAFERRFRRQTIPRILSADELVIRHVTPFPSKAAASAFYTTFVKPVVPHLEVIDALCV